jgi:hypothetical protein
MSDVAFTSDRLNGVSLKVSVGDVRDRGNGQ